MRVAALVAFALGTTGCDAVFGLEREGHWLAGYEFRKPITITSNFATDATDIPISLLTDADPDLQAHALADGTDIAVTAPDGTILDSELLRYDAMAGGLEAWVRVPAVPGQAITQLYLYYGGPSRSVVPSKTWPERFAAVWHMSETGTIEHDSTSHAHNQMGTDSAASDTGIAGPARRFTGDESYSVAETGFNFGTGSFGYSFWVLAPDQKGDFDSPFYKGGSSNEAGYCVLLGKGPWNADVSDGVTPPLALSFSTQPITDRWVQLGARMDRDAGELQVYVDGTQVASTSLNGFGSPDSPDSMQLSGFTYPFQGRVDEVRVYSGAPPPGWFALEYANLAARDDFIAIGEQETR